ncbi:YqzL family protein [Ammoniphilus oxalaticus]|nr:YqzL family protein [Ammoniphilus oxalaticus]
MQHISWNLFSATGNVDAYLLYKDYQRADIERDDESELSMHPEGQES